MYFYKHKELMPCGVGKTQYFMFPEKRCHVGFHLFCQLWTTNKLPSKFSFKLDKLDKLMLSNTSWPTLHQIKLCDMDVKQLQITLLMLNNSAQKHPKCHSLFVQKNVFQIFFTMVVHNTNLHNFFLNTIIWLHKNNAWTKIF